MTVDLLARLEGVQGVGVEKWVARCPAHEDEKASLSVARGENAWLFTCHAGCASGRIRTALNLDWRELFFVEPSEHPGGVVNIGDVRPVAAASAGPAGGTVSRVSMPPETVVKAWERALFPELVARLYELKGWSERTLRAVRAGWDDSRVTFPFYAPDRIVDGVLTAGAMVALVRYLPGGSPKSLAVGPRELWPAPESLPVSDSVWLVEGEPDRVSAVEIGLAAVSVPGVGTWKPGWAERFQGRRVTVCLDCDPQGREAASVRVSELRAAGVQAAVVDLFPARGDGYDLGDALVGALEDGRLGELRRYLMRIEDAAWRAM